MRSETQGTWFQFEGEDVMRKTRYKGLLLYCVSSEART